MRGQRLVLEQLDGTVRVRGEHVEPPAALPVRPSPSGAEPAVP